MNLYIQQHCPLGWEEFFINNNIIQHIDQQIENVRCIPAINKRFSSFYYCKPEDIKVVIIGQDPYPNESHACGLSFSTGCSIIPKSLVNIYKTMKDRVIGFIPPNHGDLSWWCTQGVFMINKALTIPVDGKSGDHVGIWGNFTRELIKFITRKQNNIVFILWGRKAQEVEKMINVNNHLVLKCNHPSPYAYDRNEFSPLNFRHMNHFNEANEYLVKNKKTWINWCFPDFFNHNNDILCYDIETNGLNLFNAKEDEESVTLSNGRVVRKNNQRYITSIAWIFNGQMKKACYHYGKYPIYDKLETFEDFIEDMKQAKMVITYNGKAFDEPFIEFHFGLKPHSNHLDLRKISNKNLKDLAKEWGLNRSSGEVDGGVAVHLWNRWLNKTDVQSLTDMINYNIDDTYETYKLFCLIKGIKCCNINLNKLDE